MGYHHMGWHLRYLFVKLRIGIKSDRAKLNKNEIGGNQTAVKILVVIRITDDYVADRYKIAEC